MRENSRGSVPLFGGSSLLVIFAVLVLTVFLLLTLTSVQTDMRLSDASIAAISDYYAADLQAEEVFARLRAGELPAQVQREDSLYWYTCPVTQTQRLDVVVCQTEAGWQVLRWKTVAADTEPADTLPVWNGNAVLEGNYD